MIEITNLNKNYVRGGFLLPKKISRGVKNLNLNIQPGAYGLLGINGAGKSTTLKMIATLLRPTSGQILINGKDSIKHEKELRRSISMITGSDRMLYFRLTGMENLLYFASLYGMNKVDAAKRCNYLLEMTGLKDVGNKRVEEYSRGMKQRLTIARGLINDPSILLLDEPTLGLDVAIAKDIRNFIKDLIERDQSRTVILTSHYMNEIEDICSNIGILQGGELIYNGNFNGLYKKLELEEMHKFIIPKKEKSSIDRVNQIVGDGINYNTNSIGDIEFLLSESLGYKLLKEIDSLNIKGLTFTQEKPALESAIVKLSRSI